MQSALFNLYLAERLQDGLLHTVLAGDVMAKVPRGGMFVAQDVAAEQARLGNREIVSAGPIFGFKTYAARTSPASARRHCWGASAWASLLRPVQKLMPGTRRHNPRLPERPGEQRSRRKGFGLPLLYRPGAMRRCCCAR
ncbi:MAG: hypothetical protein U0793_32975 [Gemmataceae bacterium]